MEGSLLDMGIQQSALLLHFWRKAYWDKVHIPALEPCVLGTPTQRKEPRNPESDLLLSR